jgi:uncharacterized damage-inducible protein DinB
MIDAEYCQMMVAYGAWMNGKIYACCERLSDDERKRDRGAFFRSIHSTLNHLLFGDRVWLPRFPGAEGLSYEVRGMGEDIYDDFEALRRAREAMDADMAAWARRVTDGQLRGSLTWYSGVARRELTRPLWLCVAQMFNHGTHHRGQVTTLLKQAGIDPGSTDLPWAPLVRDEQGQIVLGEEFAL